MKNLQKNKDILKLLGFQPVDGDDLLGEQRWNFLESISLSPDFEPNSLFLILDLLQERLTNEKKRIERTLEKVQELKSTYE